MALRKVEFERAVLYRGDCLEVMAELPEGTADMVLCDPPYGTTENPWDTVIPIPEMWAAVNRVSKPNAAQALFGMMPFACDLIQGNRKNFRYDLVWEKTMAVGFLNAAYQPLRGHELILMFYRARPEYFPQKTMGGGAYSRVRKPEDRSRNYGERKNPSLSVSDGTRHPRSVWQFGLDSEKYHPTQKPVALLEKLVLSYTRPQGVVLDFTMGSGSTGVAAVKCGRRFVGIERDPAYFDAACERIERAHAQGRLFDDE